MLTQLKDLNPWTIVLKGANQGDYVNGQLGIQQTKSVSFTNIVLKSIQKIVQNVVQVKNLVQQLATVNF